MMHLGYETALVKKSRQDLDNLIFELPSKPHLLEAILVSDQPMHCNPQSDIICDNTKKGVQPRDIGDLFNDIPGFSVIKKGGFAMDPTFRSFKYEQLNIIFDGGIQTTHACPSRMDPSTTHVSPDQVEKIELIKGPFTVRYGASMGAVINIVTESWNPENKGLGGYLQGGFESNGNAKLTQFQVQSNSKLDLLLSGGYKDYGNYISGNGTLIPSSFHAFDYSLKSGYDLGKNQRLQLNWRQAITRDVLHAGLSMDTDSDDTYFLSLDYNKTNINKFLYSLTAKAYFNKVDHIMSNSRRPNFMMTEAVSTVVADNYGGRLEATLIPTQKSLIYIGADYKYLHRDGARERLVKRNMMTGELLPQPKLFDDKIWQNAHFHNPGLFIEGRRFVNQRFTLLGGIRGDFISIASLDPAPDLEMFYGVFQPKTEFNISGTTSLSFQASKSWNINLALGRGVRTANMIERFINHFTVGLDPYEYVGNPNLKPEVNHQAELSVTKRSEFAFFQANFFYSDLTNYISAAVDTTLSRKYMSGPLFARRFMNIKNASQFGFELSCQINLTKNLSFKGNSSYTIAQNLDWNEPLPEVAPFEANLELKYDCKNWWLDVHTKLVGSQNRVSEVFDESTTSGFAVMNINVGIIPFKNLSIGVGVLNVFDQQYRTHLNRNYINMPSQGVIYDPGRNFTVLSKFKF